jgi:hypothetical protein
MYDRGDVIISFTGNSTRTVRDSSYQPTEIASVEAGKYSNTLPRQYFRIHADVSLADIVCG